MVVVLFLLARQLFCCLSVNGYILAALMQTNMRSKKRMCLSVTRCAANLPFRQRVVFTRSNMNVCLFKCCGGCERNIVRQSW